MTLHDPDPTLRWLFHPTHPDDELAFAAWARHLCASGVEVWFAWTHRTEVREREARAAAARIGVPPERIRFHDGTDGAVCDEIPRLRESFSRLIEEVRPDRVVCGAFEQGHLDHDATAFLLREAYDGVILESPFYHTYVRPRWQKVNRFSDPSREEIRALDEADRRFKIELSMAYPSQRIGKVLRAYELGHVAIGRRPELYGSERLRVMAVDDWTRPAHPPRLAARVARSPRWHRWLTAMTVAGAS